MRADLYDEIDQNPGVMAFFGSVGFCVPVRGAMRVDGVPRWDGKRVNHGASEPPDRLLLHDLVHECAHFLTSRCPERVNFGLMDAATPVEQQLGWDESAEEEDKALWLGFALVHRLLPQRVTRYLEDYIVDFYCGVALEDVPEEMDESHEALVARGRIPVVAGERELVRVLREWERAQTRAWRGVNKEEEER